MMQVGDEFPPKEDQNRILKQSKWELMYLGEHSHITSYSPSGYKKQHDLYFFC